MTTIQPTPAAPDEERVLDVVVEKASDISKSEDFKSKIYQAISVQRPVVLEYLKSLRRGKPNATAAEILKELDKRYVATVTITSTGVGASAAIPVVGIPLALGLGVIDLLFFYETSALYVLAATELHGIEVSDAERARPLVFGMLLGQKSQSQVAKLVRQAAGAGGVDQARALATGMVGRRLPAGWGEVLTQQLPDSALAPLETVIARRALMAGAKFEAGTLGKAIPFGFGAVVGGVGSFTFGRDVVKAARLAFPMPPTDFPEALLDFQKPEPEIVEPSRAVKALQSAADNVSDFGEAVWDKATDVVDVFRSVDIDGDGVPDEARALTAARRARSAITGAAVGSVGAVGSLFKRKGDDNAAEKPEPDPGDEPAKP
ncbi:MAG TPA: hypothetical protein VKI23_01280 [Cellulomonadaceae bacterium]|nr:hypothetical protein [Cellulomonadaceae bacterium]